MNKQKIQEFIDNGLHDKFVAYLNTQEIQVHSYAYCIQTDSFMHPDIQYTDYCKYDYIAIDVYTDSISYAVPFEGYIPLMGKGNDDNRVSIAYKPDNNYIKCNCCHAYTRKPYKVLGANVKICRNCKINWEKVMNNERNGVNEHRKVN